MFDHVMMAWFNVLPNNDKMEFFQKTEASKISFILQLKSAYKYRLFGEVFENPFQNLQRATETSFCPILACDKALESFNIAF